ncbi:MAG: SocA family protein [Desulfobacterales bacterium]|nr:SocA family protein [Desulfobacterales bacterium]
MKLLYFLDFMHFKQTGKSVTDLNYYAWKRGPVPKTLWKEISGDMCDDLKQAITIVPIEHFQKIVSKKKKFDDKHFTKREIKLLKLTADIFMVKKALKGDLEKKRAHPQPENERDSQLF